MLEMGKFGDAQLERLYRQHQLSQNTSLLVYVLCVFTASLLMLALNHLPRPDVVLLLATISAALALALNILLNLRTMTKQSGLLTVIGVWLCATIICMMPSGDQNALLPTVIACFSLYTLFPYDMLWTILTALCLSLTQIAVYILLPTHPFTVDQLLATVLIHVWSNFIGIYLYATKNRLARAAFLNSRNVLVSQHEALKNQAELETLLTATCPSHSLQMALNYLCKNKPTMTSVHIEKYDEVTVLYATFSGLEAILSQITVQDAARLLNEFNSRIEQLSRKNNFVRIPSDAIVFACGLVPDSNENQGQLVCQAAWDLLTVVRSFCEASTSDLQIKIGVATGHASTGIIGQNKWHYELCGPAFEEARQLSSLASMGTILISDKTQNLIEEDFVTEKVELNRVPYWRLLQSKTIRPSIPNTMLFPNQRRMSLVTVPQAINRLLQTSFTANNETTLLLANGAGRRKSKKITDSIYEKLELDEAESSQFINFVSMTFNESAIEKGYQFEVDRWFIPALATCIFFLVIYGIYQMLVLPRLILTLGLIILSLAIMFWILLMLYISYFESFCHFVTRTSAGHSIIILLIIVLLFVCGIVNTFFCPPYSNGSTCQLVYYPVMSCVLWMLTAPVFVRFSSLYLLLTLIAGISVFSLHVFLTHADLYMNFALLTGWRIEYDLLIGLSTLAILIYVQSRRNERLIRMDYLSHIRFVENMKRFDRVNEFISLVLNSQLPEHIALNYLSRTDPYSHLGTVGVLTARFGNSDDWLDDAALSRMQELLKEIDQLAMTHIGLEKVRSSHSTYTAAVGVLPEVNKNVHDAPFTIGDLLAALTNFGIALKDIANEEKLDICIGVDVGPALSLIIGGNKPYYDVVGTPRLRSIELMKAASTHTQKLIISEEVYLALRPRHFDFDDKNPIHVSHGLIGYGFRQSQLQNNNSPPTNSQLPPASTNRSLQNSHYQQEFAPHKDVGSSAESTDAEDVDQEVRLIEETTQSTTLPTLDTNSPVATHSTKPFDLHSLGFFTQQNQQKDGQQMGSPKHSMFNSMNSSISSELYSIDLSVETDSEMEWVTPEMLVYDRLQKHRRQNNQSAAGAVSLLENHRTTYKGDHAKQYSDFSEAENIRGSSRFRRKRYHQPLSRNGPKIPVWLSSRTSFNSELSLPHETSMTALDKLNVTAKRVDRMLQELSNLNPTSEITKIIDCAPFPLGFTGISASTKSVNSNRREMSSAGHTDYDNAESEGALSDSEMISNARLEDLKHALKVSSNNNSALALDNRRHKRSRLSELAYQLGGFGSRKKRLLENGNEADIDSNCSSLASSAMFDKLRWKSVHSIGYENEYEFASEPDEDTGNSRQSELSMEPLPMPENFHGAVGNNVDFRAMDAEDSDENGNVGPSVRQQLNMELQQITRDICKNFGELTSFSDVDN